MKRPILLLLLSLFWVMSHAQSTSKTIFKVDDAGYPELGIHKNNEVLFVESKGYQAHNIHLYNTRTQTADIIDFKRSSYHNLPSYFFNFGSSTYYVYAEKYRDPDFYIIQFDGFKQVKRFEYKDFTLDSVIQTSNHLYILGAGDKSGVIPFNVSEGSFQEQVVMDVWKGHAMGDSLAVFNTYNGYEARGVYADGSTWSLNNNASLTHLGRSSIYFRGELFFVIGSRGLYKTDGTENNMELVWQLPGFLRYAAYKKIADGFAIYNIERVHYYQASNSWVNVILDSLRLYNEPHPLGENEMVFFQNATLFIYNTVTNTTKSLKPLPSYSYERGMVSNELSGEVYMALTIPRQSYQDQNFYGIDENGRLMIYNKKPLRVSKDGNVSGFTQVNGNLYFILQKNPGYSFHMLPSSAAGYSSMLNLNGFADQNQNGVQEKWERDLASFTLLSKDGTKYFFSGDKTDVALFPKGENSFRLLSRPYSKFTTDSIINIKSGKFTSDTTISVGLYARPIPKLEVHISIPRQRCGFPAKIRIKVINSGMVPLKPGIRFTTDSLISIDSFGVKPDSSSKYRFVWKLDSIFPDEWKVLEMYYRVPGTEFIGEDLKFNYSYFGRGKPNIKIWSKDSIIDEIRCAYDPNDKMVWPMRKSLGNQTLFSEKLTYRIRFQNTGTDTAFNIVVADTLSPNLDWRTFKIADHSHPMTTKMYDNGLVEFIFRDILLPDSHVNEPESHGYIYYTIRAKEGLKEESPVYNRAHIFFDYNPAIVTNTTNNLMVSKLNYGSINPPRSDKVLIYPNPAQSILHLILPAQGGATVKLFDTNGRQVFEKQLDAQNPQLDVSQLSNGIYLLKVQQGNDLQEVVFNKI